MFRSHIPPPRPSMGTVWQETRHLVHQHRLRLATGLVLMIISRGAGMVLPASSKYVIDTVIIQRAFDALGGLALIVGVATLVQVGANFSLSQLLGVAAERVMADMRTRIHGHVLRLPVATLDATRTGAMVSRIMTDSHGVQHLIGTGLIHLVGGLLTSLASVAVLIWIDARITGVILLVIALLGVGLFATFGYLRPVFRDRGQLMALATGRLTETLGGIRVVKTYAMEEREAAAFAADMEALADNGKRSVIGWSLVNAQVLLAIGAIGVVLILMGGAAYRAGTVTLGDLGMYLLFTGLATAPLIQMTQVGTRVTEAFAGLDRIRTLLNTPTEDDDEPQRRPVPTLQGQVRFEGVHFAYVPGVPVLSDITFDAPAGTTTALVGPSGAGKSTLLSLLTTFDQPSAGRILVDGLDLGTLRRREYRRQLGVVFQETFLFDGSIFDNIRFARPDATLAEVHAVARAAHCEEFIDSLPRGWDTVVGERGVRLSGGQRQRVAIARAILADPAILLLDEATASLDSESEGHVRQALATLRQHRTAFVIAHRLSTIRAADQILVLDHGRIVERGRHDDLLAHDGMYRRLHDHQQAVVGDRFVNPGEIISGAVES
jgi:subfamily B ATP-binding cassette protein MsbA